MKRFLCCTLFFSLALICGCRTYIIDSHPRGLRVTINDIERGLTPLEYETMADFSYNFNVEVTPPTQQQIRAYEVQNNKIVSIWHTGAKQKHIYPDDSPSGTILFQFISSEYDIPQTEEERIWTINALEADATRIL